MTTTTTRLTISERRRRRASSLLLPKAGASVFIREPNRARPRLAVYVRLSLAQLASVSIARQRQTLTGYVVDLDGVYDPEVDYFEDDDLSAKGTVYRPAAEELLRRVIAGHYDGVVVWEFARFMCTVRETHIACGLMREHSVELYSFEERHLTLYGPGRIALEFAADQAEKELLKISARVAAAKAFLAQHGAAPAHAPFGLRKVVVPSPIAGREAPIHRLAPDERPRETLGDRSPADLVRDLAARVLAGESMRRVAMDWNAAGYLSPTGSDWSSTTLSRMLRNPLLAGYAVSRGEVVTDADGQPVRFHKPLLADDTWADLCALVAGRPAHPRSGVDAPLRGLLRCGRCGGAMARTARGSRGSYRCARRSGGGNCAGNTITAPQTEAYITEAVLSVLADPVRLAQVRAGDPGAAEDRTRREQEARRLRTALERVDTAQALGEYDDPDGARRFAKVKGDLLAQLERLVAADRLTRPRRRPALAKVEGLSVVEAFDAATPAQRLTMLGELVEHATVLPAAHRVTPAGARAKWDPDRLVITWQTGEL